MSVKRLLPILAALAGVMIVAAMVSAGSSDATQVRAEIAPHFSHEGLEPGDPLAGGTLLLYDGDEVVLTSVLDEQGTALVDPAPGVYDVQLRLDSTEDPLCFWGTTEFGIEFPASPLTLQVGVICAGG